MKGRVKVCVEGGAKVWVKGAASVGHGGPHDLGRQPVCLVVFQYFHWLFEDLVSYNHLPYEECSTRLVRIT